VNHLRKLATMLLGLALIGGMLSAASASPKAAPKASLPARFSPGSIRVLYRGMTPPLSDLAAGGSAVPHVTDPGYGIDSAHFRQLNANEAGGVPPIIGWTVPTVP